MKIEFFFSTLLLLSLTMPLPAQVGEVEPIVHVSGAWEGTITYRTERPGMYFETHWKLSTDPQGEIWADTEDKDPRQAPPVLGRIRFEEKQLFKVKDASLLVELLQEGNEMKGISLRYDAKEDAVCPHQTPPDIVCVLGTWVLTRKGIGQGSDPTGLWKGPFTYQDEKPRRKLEVTWTVVRRENGTFKVQESSRKVLVPWDGDKAEKKGDEDVREVPSKKPDILLGTLEKALVGHDKGRLVILFREGNRMTGVNFPM